MGVAYNISVNVTWEDLRELSPEQCDAFMRGVAKVVSANPYAEDDETENAKPLDTSHNREI
jgi:hypothetical protein